MEQFNRSIRTFFFISSVEIVLAAGYLISLPTATNQNSGIVMGFSGMRSVLLILLALIFIVMMSIWLMLHFRTRIGYQVEISLFSFFQRKSLLNGNLVSISGIVVSTYLLFKWFALDSSYEYSITLPRLLPLGFLSLIFFLQLYWIISYPGRRLQRIRFQKFSNWVKSGIPARKIAIDLLIIVFLLAFLSIGFQWIKYFTPYYPYLDFLIVEFFVDSEENIPTYFSGFLLIFSALLLFIKATDVKRAHGKFLFHWYFLSLIFVFLAIDDMVQIHESLTEPVRQILNTSGAFFFAWYIPIIPLLFFLGLYFLKFVFSLPKQQKNGYILSGLIFLCGAIGIEIVGSAYGHKHGLGNFPYTMLATLEEFLEMSGTILFIYFTWDLVQINSPKTDSAKPKE